MKSYLNLLRRCISDGVRVPARPVLASTGERPDCLSLFGATLRHDLDDGFPLLTTKRVFWRGVVHELVWFLRGDTNVRYLHEHGVTIWDEWLPADGSGDLGPIYGKQWRDFGGVDQVRNVVESLKALASDPHHPSRRRLVVSAWNPPDVPSMALPPCHTAFQALPVGHVLNLHVFCRSIDVFLGLPFNVASYAALTHFLAAQAGLVPGVVQWSITDLHLYTNHLDAAREQLSREPRPLPRLRVEPTATLDDVCADHFTLDGYAPCPAIKAEVAI